MSTLTAFEATLGEDTMHEILRRYPDESFDRNNNDPHPFAVWRYEVYPTRWDTEPGVKDGWWEDGRRIA
jgi:hypothetical protein